MLNLVPPAGPQATPGPRWAVYRRLYPGNVWHPISRQYDTSGQADRYRTSLPKDWETKVAVVGEGNAA